MSLPAANLTVGAGDMPDTKFISLASNLDHRGCEGSGPTRAYFFTSKPGTCFEIEAPPGTEKLTISFEVGGAGITPTACTGAKSCEDECQQFGLVPFGSCWKPIDGIALTLNAVDELPTPTAGRVLEKRCLGVSDCDCDEVYYMFKTGCTQNSRGGGDYKPTCGDGLVARYSSHQYEAYGSDAGTCTGAPRAAVTIPSDKCTNIGSIMSAQSVWCGEGCSIWKTLRASYPYCDDPGDGTPYAVNLTRVLGNMCSLDTPVGACCFIPLGYPIPHHPPIPYGYNCARACQEFLGRHGSTHEWCGKSDGSHYGNCKRACGLDQGPLPLLPPASSRAQ